MHKSYLLLCVAIFCSACVVGQPGNLDGKFGSGGKVLTQQAGGQMQGKAIAIEAGGKYIVLAQNRANATSYIFRYNQDGSLDTSFGDSGRVAVVILPTAYNFMNTMIIQPDGKILTAGSTYKPAAMDADYAIARYNSDGSVDSSFGNNGVFTMDLYSGQNNLIFKLALRPDGKILAAGGTIYTTILQLTAAGTLDSVFADFTRPFPIAIRAFARQDDGKLLATGTDFTIERFLPNGKPDSTWGINGFADTLFSRGQASAIYVQKDGKVVSAGYVYQSGYKIALTRMQSNGQPDSTFGVNGAVVTPVGVGQSMLYEIYETAENKLLMTGFAEHYSNSDFLLLRYNSDGTLDNTFGKHGILKTDFSGYHDRAFASVMQPDGKLILAGESADNTGNIKLALARYNDVGVSKYNTITGVVYSDFNANGMYDVKEYPVNAAISFIKPGIDTFVLGTTGTFSLQVDTGTWVTSVLFNHFYQSSAPSSRMLSYSTYFNHDTVFFGIQPSLLVRDLAVTLIPLTPVRPGFQVRQKLIYTNNGTDTALSVTVKLVKDSRLAFDSADPAPALISADTLVWNFSNNLPYDTADIQIYLKAPASTIHIGDTVSSLSSIVSEKGDTLPDDNVFTLVQPVTGSFDPNDKTESHAGQVKLSKITNGEHLTYSIRFQNTGTDTAFNVYIHDTLSSKLDWSTMQMLASSHHYQLTMNDNICVWHFSNINLVDSNMNESLSHGYLQYRIKPRMTVAIGDVITNSAAIYFDYNLPVITNIEKTTVVAEVVPLKLLSFSARRDGKTNLLHWSTAQEINEDRFEVQRGSNAREFGSVGSVKSQAGNNNRYEFTDAVPLKGVNYYRLKMIDKDGSHFYSPVRTVNNSSSFDVFVYPNPAKDQLQVQLESEKETELRVQVLSQDGKVLLMNKWSASEGTSVRSINISSLQIGSYYLKVSSSDKELSVVKFEKM